MGTPSSGFEPETTRLTAGGSTRLSYDGSASPRSSRLKNVRTSADELADVLHGPGDLVEHALEVVEEVVELVRRDRAVLRRLHEPFLLEDPQGISDLVLGVVQ